jgi:hypothetical protein
MKDKDIRSSYSITAVNITARGAIWYNRTIGMNGGYFNLAMNNAQQSIATGESFFSLEGKSLSGLLFSSFTTYSTSVSGQMAIGVSDPWLNLTYNSERGTHLGGGLITKAYGKASLQSLASLAFGPFGGHTASKCGLNPDLSKFMNFGMETNLLWISNQIPNQ